MGRGAGGSSKDQGHRLLPEQQRQGDGVLEQSIYGASELNKKMIGWLTPMITGAQGVETTVAQIKPLVDGIVAEFAQQASEGR